jgi:hypothetical protein
MKAFDRNEFTAQIRERAGSDAAFRSQLLSDPSAAVSALLGMPVPENVTITVHEETPADVHLVIPASVNLNEADLELVAGGFDWSERHLSCACG